MEDALIIKTSFDRPNLYIQIKQKTSFKNDLYDLLKKHENEYVVVYCQTRKYTEKITEEINAMGLKSHSYHAGLSMSQRAETQEKYKKGEYKCIVATIAFGMGIDVPNIRLIIHYNCPNNLEQYYQGIGRAGRDGKYSECYVFYSGKDYHISKFLLKDIQNEEYKKEELSKCKKIYKFINSNKCRRRVLLKYFGEKYKTKCDNCDNCKIKIKIDITEDSIRLLLLLSEFNHFGKNVIINIIRGSSAKNITTIMKNNINYGMGKNKTIDHWKYIINELIRNKYIQEVELGLYIFIKLDVKGEKHLENIIDKYSDLLINRDFKYIFEENDKIYI